MNRDVRFPLAVLALLGLMGVAQIASIRQESQTWDEGIHLAAGYSYVRTGDYRINLEHPPLGKILNALPLLFLHPTLPLPDPSQQPVNEVEFGRRFLYQNRVPADKMLFTARCVTIAFTLLLGAVLALWSRRRFGDTVALLALSLFVFDPNIIAHGRYVTSDPFVVVFVFLACIAWSEYLRTPTARRLLLAGGMLGLALASKMSALFLPPVFALLYVVRWWYESSRPRRVLSMLKHLSVVFATAMMIALTVVMLTYAPEIRAAANLPFHSYLMCLDLNWNHLRVGHEGYLLGKTSSTGWWYYFPVAVLVKTPTATVALFVISMLAGAVKIASRVRRKAMLSWRALPFECYALAIPSAVFFAISMVSHVDIGIRHVLPIYPLMYVLLAWMFVSSGRIAPRWASRLVTCLLVGGLVAESLSIYPHYLAFFNLPSGGPGNGPRYLLDSNLDWGQDLKKLKAWMDARNVTELDADYFGTAPPSYYGIQSVAVRANENPESWKELRGVVAVSATPLYGLYTSPERFAPLRKRQPTAKIGYSIYVYDFRQPLPSGPAPAGKYDDLNPRIAYSGEWLHDYQFPQAAAGSLTYSNEPGASFEFLFHGTEITYVYTKAFNRGFAAVSIDRIPRASVDLYSKTTEWQSSTQFAVLANGDHVLTIRVTGGKRPEASDCYVDVDRLIVKEQ